MKTRPGPRRGPRVPVGPARRLKEWGRTISAAHRAADANRSPGARSPLAVREPYRSKLIAAIQAAYADGWSYAALERASGIGQRQLRQWAVGRGRDNASGSGSGSGRGNEPKPAMTTCWPTLNDTDLQAVWDALAAASDGPMSRSDLAAVTGRSRKKVDKAVKVLQIRRLAAPVNGERPQRFVADSRRRAYRPNG